MLYFILHIHVYYIQIALGLHRFYNYQGFYVPLAHVEYKKTKSLQEEHNIYTTADLNQNSTFKLYVFTNSMFLPKLYFLNNNNNNYIHNVV